MLENDGDKKELATNRLLEILRGDSAEEDAEVAEAKIGLSEEEQAALTGPVPTPGMRDSKTETQKASPRSLNDFLDAARRRVMQLIKPEKGLIGLDIGSDSIKFVYFTKEKNEIVLRDMGLRKIEEHYTRDPRKKQDNMRNALNDLISDDIKKTSVLSSIISGTNVSIKKITLPKITKRELKDAIIWNAKKELPFSGDDAMFDYKVLGAFDDKGIEKTEVLVAVVDNKLIDERVQFFESISLNPGKLIAVPLSIYYNFLHYMGNTTANGVVIDIGAHITQIIFVQEGNLQFAREISTGGEDISTGMMGSISGKKGVIKIDKEEAERLKFVYGIPAEDAIHMTESGISLNQIASVMRPTLERLLVQIQRSFDYYRTKFPFEEPDKVYITGGTSLLKNLDSFLAEGLNKEVEILNPLRGVVIEPGLEEEKNVSAVAPSLAVAVGCVFADSKGINLLPQFLKDKVLFAFQKRILTAAAALVFFILTALSISAYADYNSVGTRLQQLQENKRPNDMLHNQQMQLVAERNKLVSAQLREQQQYEALAGTVHIDDYLKLMGILTPREITLENMTIDLDKNNTMRIIGTVNVDVSIAEIYLSQFLTQLQKSGMFVKVNPYRILEMSELGMPADDSTENIMGFEIVCTLPESVNHN